MKECFFLMSSWTDKAKAAITILPYLSLHYKYYSLSTYYFKLSIWNVDERMNENEKAS